MEVERRGDCAAALDEPQLGQPGGRCRVFQRLVFQRVLVRRDEDARDQRGVFGRQAAGRELGSQVRLPFRREAFLLQTGLGCCQRFGRRRAVAALALLMKIDRRRVQLQQQRHRFGRPRRVAVVLLRQLLEAEFLAACRFPQEIGVEFGRQRLGFGHHLGRHRRGEAQQDIGRLDLAALARGRLHLRRGVGFGQDGAGLEMAVLFKDEMHGKSEIQDGLEVVFEPGKAVVAAVFDDLRGACVVGDGVAVVEHLVAGLRQQQIALGLRDGGNVECREFGQMRLGKFPLLAAVPVGLRAKCGAQQRVCVHGGVHQHRFPAVPLGQVGGIEAAQRTADQGDGFRVALRQFGLDLGNGRARAVGERRAIVIGLPPEVRHVLAQLPGLAGCGRGVEAVEIDNHPQILPGRLPFQKLSVNGP